MQEAVVETLVRPTGALLRANHVVAAEAQGRRGYGCDRLQRAQSELERDIICDEGERELGKGARGDRGRRILSVLVRAHEIECSRESGVRGSATEATGECPADMQPRRLRILRERLLGSRETARRDAAARDQVEREGLQGTRDLLPEARELREALTKALRRAHCEAQPCRDGVQHD